MVVDVAIDRVAARIGRPIAGRFLCPVVGGLVCPIAVIARPICGVTVSVHPSMIGIATGQRIGIASGQRDAGLAGGGGQRGVGPAIKGAIGRIGECGAGCRVEPHCQGDEQDQDRQQ